ncbi:hypothetical protein RH915_10900 [Serpentinicella sp. ANB-PHB4]|uniref:hypothetical protein n=1 Tax=Serpentinicella sp. ANB-PHB4 TaxID=3074076 RepID=UPI00285DB767|nr:hypothetical protein [Serpentinicella sp. ANB-PHB4]MDR5659997.1 hypothetical protein [Serpentinicella sp. ANB-PHB4]
MLTIENNRDIFNKRVQRVIKSNENRSNEDGLIGVEEVELILRYQSDGEGNIKCIHCSSINLPHI